MPRWMKEIRRRVYYFQKSYSHSELASTDFQRLGAIKNASFMRYKITEDKDGFETLEGIVRVDQKGANLKVTLL